ncbi:MAG: CrcB family protein [Streptococcaceae bacterium]|jgi:CrcB protein|nr:CrcB family protein [Streptococcaceae bacterium]
MLTSIEMVALIGIGAGCGAVVRYLVSKNLSRFVYWEFPIGTFFVNILGSLFLGFLFAQGKDSSTFMILGTGFCGGLTTFSTLNTELLLLLETKKYKLFFKYLGSTYFLGMISCLMGIVIGMIV